MERKLLDIPLEHIPDFLQLEKGESSTMSIQINKINNNMMSESLKVKFYFD